MLLSPSPNSFKISACMLCIEVNEGVQALRFILYPNRPEDADIDAAHETLSKEVKAVTDVPPLNVFRVTERPFST